MPPRTTPVRAGKQQAPLRRHRTSRPAQRSIVETTRHRVMPHRKPHLPEKPCAVCGRPFAWRKKWEKVWDEVRYCSDACRARRSAAPSPPGKP